MSDFVTVLKGEIAALVTDIRENPDPRQKKLARLRETLAEYEPSQPTAPTLRVRIPPRSPPTSPPLQNGGTSPFDLVATTKAAKMKAEITKLLTTREKMHRKAILNHLVSQGIMGKEGKPMQALAIFLSSRRADFSSDGEGNFSLRGKTPEAPRRLPLP
jgi:hypothetical protein